MYSENDLNLVSSSIPIYTKAALKGKSKTPKRGHFECSGCDAGRLSGTRTYITALVYDFDLIGACFAFLFSRADTHYQTPNDAFTQQMATTLNYDWVYRAKNEVRNTLVHVRGWWDILGNRDFKHKNGVINLGDHCNFDNPDLDGDEIINPEFGIKMFIAPYAGIYRSWKQLENIGTWNEDDVYRNTFVHPGTDRIVQIMNPSWTRYGESKPRKKGKHKLRRHDGQAVDEAAPPRRGGGDGEDALIDVPPIRTIEEREDALAAMHRPRRTARGAAQGRVANERGRLRFTDPAREAPRMNINAQDVGINLDAAQFNQDVHWVDERGNPTGAPGEVPNVQPTRDGVDTI